MTVKILGLTFGKKEAEVVEQKLFARTLTAPDLSFFAADGGRALLKNLKTLTAVDYDVPWHAQNEFSRDLLSVTAMKVVRAASKT